MTRIQLDQGYIEVDGVDFPIDLAFNDIKENGARAGGYSRVIEVKGTAKNSVLLGYYFDVDLEGGDFNRNKKTECTVIQNDTEVFTGFIQLIEVIRENKTTNTNAKKVSYKVAVFDKVSNFFNEMGEKELSDLSLSNLGHVFDRDTIIASWDRTDGYIYPQFAKDNNVYTLRDFKPAIFEFEYFDRIFQSNGYSYTWAQMDDADIRFKQRFIPYNGKAGDEDVSLFLQDKFKVKGEDTDLNYNYKPITVGWLPKIDIIQGGQTENYATTAGSIMTLSTILADAQSQWDGVANRLENKAGGGRTFTFRTSYDYELKFEHSADWEVLFGATGVRLEVMIVLVAQSVTNPNKVAYIDGGSVAAVFEQGTSYTYAGGVAHTIGSGTNSSIAQLGLFDLNEEIHFHFLTFGRYYNAQGQINTAGIGYAALDPSSPFVSVPVTFNEQSTGDFFAVNIDVDVRNLTFEAIPDIQELVKGTEVDPTFFIPKGVKQRDLIAAIAKSYNLVFVPDSNNDRNLIIKTRDKYFDDGAEWDWSELLDESQQNGFKFLSNEVNRDQSFKYKNDKDPLNEAYQSEYAETYGQSKIRLDNEYAQGEDKRELLYSPTPSVVSGIGVPLPSIDGVTPDNNIRVLLNGGKKTVFAYPFFDDTLATPSSLEWVGHYHSSSMMDDDFTPNFSILFNAPKVLFHSFQTGQTSNYLYNLHHVRETTQLNQGKLFTGFFNINEVAFQKLSQRLDWKIYIRDNGWFYINKVHKYNAGKRTLTQVELVTADDATRLKVLRPFIPLPIVDATPSNEYYSKVNANSNIVIGKSPSIVGRYNFVVGDNVTIIGDKNTVLASGARVIGDEQMVTESKVVINGVEPSNQGNVLYKARIVQSGTSDPVITEYVNNVGTITALRTATGVYLFSGFPSGTFDGIKNIQVQLDWQRFSTSQEAGALSAASTSLVVQTWEGGVLADGVLNSMVGAVRYHVLTITEY